MSRSSLSLAGRLLGEGQPCLVVAHVGHAHEGSAERALKLIEAAFQAGADAHLRVRPRSVRPSGASSRRSSSARAIFVAPSSSCSSSRRSG